MTKKDKKIIDDSERRGIPIFVITAKDRASIRTLIKYYNACENIGCHSDHLWGVTQRINDFAIWQRDNSDFVKTPD